MSSRQSRKILVVILTVACLIGFYPVKNLQARQVNFSKQLHGTQIKYSYYFATPSGKKHKLHFKLDRSLVEQSQYLFTQSGKRKLNQRVQRESEQLFESLQTTYIEQARDEFDRYINEQILLLPSGITILNKNKGKNIHASSDGSIPKARAEVLIDEFLEKLSKKWQKLNQSYIERFEIDVAKKIQNYYIDMYKNNYYVASFSSLDDRNFSLRIDFEQVAKLQKDALKPVADAIANRTHGLPMRDVINYAAYFIQSIPYDTLNSRNAHDQVGFVAPLTLFDINRGDCDTKSTALAAILRNIYPELDIKMVLIPNHAFLALGLKGKEADTAIIYNDMEYVLLEAAGPALTRVGKSYESSLRHMQMNPDKIGRILPIL